MLFAHVVSNKSNNLLLLICRPVSLADDQESVLERNPWRTAVVYQGKDKTRHTLYFFLRVRLPKLLETEIVCNQNMLTLFSWIFLRAPQITLYWIRIRKLACIIFVLKYTELAFGTSSLRGRRDQQMPRSCRRKGWRFGMPTGPGTSWTILGSQTERKATWDLCMVSSGGTLVRSTQTCTQVKSQPHNLLCSTEAVICLCGV